MKNSEYIVPVERLEKSILLIRGQKVMIDRNLAELYEVETRVLNQAVTRHLNRFPDDFMFELTREEVMRVSQFVISSNLKFSNRVRVFTEQGVAMLSTVLNSDRAIDVNIAIMRTFVNLREMLASNTNLARKLATLEKKYDEQFKIVFDAIRALMETPKPKKKIPIGFRACDKKAVYNVKKRKSKKGNKSSKKLKEIIKSPPPKSKRNASVLDALLKERAEGR